MHIKGLRRLTIIVAAAGLTAGSLLAAPAVQAAPVPNFETVANTVDAKLGSRSAGSYLDSTGKMVVTVTNSADAKTVAAAGGVPKMVERSGAQLNGVQQAIDASSATQIPGISWGVDPVTNQVVVRTDETVKGARLAKVKRAVAKLGGAVRMEREAGTYSLLIRGGDAIYTGGSRCSLGFNVRNSAGTQFFLTAGHCTNIGATWYANSSRTTVLGNRAGSVFPGQDRGIVRYTNGGISKPGTVNLYPGTQDITRSANASVGQSARRSGSTTGVRSGRVTGLNQTVRYPQGTVRGLIRTSICAQPGDSGGSLFSGSTALGMTSGGSGNCSTGGTTFFEPVTRALSAWGVRVY